ncbi:MAG: 23S rRNA (uracil(1939)-C(5))-methyltransferase RlmD [Ruminococcaceae bacterium]|nr:23S rRNA (uracil(1939)-C(5))-methyltransferase RlmD [Oscillospiraceae bacterium]
MPQKNEIMTLTACGYTNEGEGVCRAEGFVVFVPGMLEGEQAEVQLLKVKKTYAYGKIVRLLNQSEERNEIDCPSFPQCGGCKLRHMSYEEELKLKKQLVTDAVERIGGLHLKVWEVRPSPKQFHYRNKAQLPVGMENGVPVTGFFAARSHRLVSCQNCLIGDERTDLASKALAEYMQKTGATVYDETTHRGLIRHLYLRYGTEKTMVCVVTNGKKLPNSELLCEKMRNALGEQITVVQNVNTEKTNVVLGKEMIPLFGDGTISDRLCGLEFQISPHSFFQVNHAQTEQLYQKAVELSAVSKEDTILDLYCGIGTMTLLFADKAKKAYGVEIVPQAIENAKKNAEKNGIENVEFLCGDASTAVKKFENEPVDVVVVDPPRTGCSAELIDSILKISPKRIIYVSCNPATLARDMKLFAESGYMGEEVYPFDMFPRTAHVETVALLTKLKESDSITVELNLDELEVTAPEMKATYGQIKEYVLNKYGFKVSSLNIAQVKKECGIIERENYNKPSDDYKQPNCPKTKADAIKDAFKYFKMIN